MKVWIVVLVLAFVLGSGSFVATKIVKSGKIVGPATPAGADGIVPGRAEDLAREAGLEKSIYALARMIASEHGRDSTLVKTAIAWVAKNEAKARRVSIFELLTKSNKAGGQFGAQYLGRYASTRVPPTQDDVDVALAVMGGSVPDPTGGARRFYSPKAQDKLTAKGEIPGYKKTSAQLEASWMAEGWRKVAVAGVDEGALTFFRKVA